MRKIFILMAMTIAVFSSCVDNDDNPMPTTTGVEQAENPTEDALSVMSNHSYVTYGEFDEEFGHALGRRLQGTMTSPSMADVFVIDPSAVNKSNFMSTHELKTMIRRTESGEASVVLTKATFREFYDWAQLYVLGYLLMELENYHGDHGYDSPAAAPARRKMANVMRNAYMAGQQRRMLTRGATVNGMELDWEHVNTWPEEDQNAVMFDGFAQSSDNELFVMNAAATLNANAEVRHPQNDHEWGHKADAVTHWLNRQDAEKARTRAGLKNFARAITRSGNSDISDMMSAQTKDFVFDYQYPARRDPSIWTAHSAIKVQYRAYSAYDFHDNVEYYQVRQNITAMNDQIHNVINGSGWWARSNDGDYTLARGDWMKRIDTKMWLEGNGTKSIVSAAPLNENGSSSGSTSSGGSASTTIGSSDGCSIGISAGMSGWNPTFSMSESYTHTESYSETTGITWNTSTNWSTKDLTTVCTQSNDPTGTVTWTHTGNTPTDFPGTESDNVKTLLKTTCVTDEQVLWKVQNPSDKYTLKASLNVVSEIVKNNGGDWATNAVFVSQDNPHEISFELNAPDRFKRKWNCVIYDYGTAPEGMSQIEYTNYIDDFIEKSYGNNSANFCWATLFTSTEATADGSDNAASVFQTFKNSICGMKQQLRTKGISGRLVFGLKPDGVDVTDPNNLTDKIAINLDASGYNEGETFTEKVNGYDITYKVTKKDSEVELSSVPDGFTGELNIPASVCDDKLTVTSLGNNSAVRRKGITAVTIPSTVKTIQNGALAELNITEIIVPEGVTDISTWAFHADKEATKVYLPSTLKTIEYSAFRDMDKLAEVHIKATTPPTIGDFLFYPHYDTAKLYVPKGCKDAYAQAREWQYFGQYQNIVEE